MQRGLRLFGIIPLLVLLAVWEVLARSGVYSAALLPTPLEVGRVLISDAGDLLKHTRIETGAIFEPVDTRVDFVELGGIAAEYAWHRLAQEFVHFHLRDCVGFRQ